MKEHQARGIVLEAVLRDLLTGSSGLIPQSPQLSGLGGTHRVDFCALLSTPVAFLPPLRILGEVKFHSQKIECAQLYEFAGVLRDIEAFAHTDSPARYHNAGCVFSATAFSVTAQKFAWANGMYLLSMESSRFLKPTLSFLQDFIHANRDAIRDVLRDQLIAGYRHARNTTYLNQNYNRPSLTLGILNGICPALLCGEGDWLSALASGQWVAGAESAQQYGDSFETRIDFRLAGHQVEILLPTVFLEKTLAHPLSAGSSALWLDLPMAGKPLQRINLPVLRWEQSTI